MVTVSISDIDNSAVDEVSAVSSSMAIRQQSSVVAFVTRSNHHHYCYCFQL
jgi:hypothetical protein